MSEYIIEMKHITKRFPGIVANDDVTLQIKKGEIFALLGENGAGKSTLMSMIFGMYEPDEGEIFIRGKKEQIHSPSYATKLNIGMVHQHFKLVQNYTITENIILGLKKKDKLFGILPYVDLKKADQEIEALSKKYGLEVNPIDVIENTSVSTQQRVEILKMLYREAEILIFDEPTRGIDVGAKNEIYKLMNRLAAEGKSIIMISSEMTEVLRMSDRIIVMCEGKITGNIDISEATQEHIMNKATRNID